MLKGKVPEVKRILSQFTYPYNRRIAGAHGSFSKQAYKKWLKKAEREDLAAALRRLAQLNQTKVYLFWKNPAYPREVSPGRIRLTAGQ